MMGDISHVRGLLAHPQMEKLAHATCAALFAVALLPQSASADVSFRITSHDSRPVTTDRRQWKPVSIVLPARGVTPEMVSNAARSATVTLPFYGSQITSPLDHKRYTFFMVGSNPTAAVKTSTTISYVPIALRVHFDDGTILDPTQPGCKDSVSVANRFLGSPVFQNVVNVSNGINVGTTQVLDAFQRAEFWNFVKGSNYHVLLKAAAPLRVVDVLTLGYSTVPGVCSGSNHNLGTIDVSAYDSVLQAVTNLYATPSQLPIIFSYNVVLSDSSGSCCILGYHSAYSRGTNIQVYGTGDYLDFGTFANSPNIADIHIWLHELGELFNDPFVGDATPAWGHAGQVSGCQNNLEVGDPLTGTAYSLVANGFRYHPQEMAFFDWFYRTRSSGTNAKYSYEGTFRAPQGACH